MVLRLLSLQEVQFPLCKDGKGCIIGTARSDYLMNRDVAELFVTPVLS